MAIWSIENGLDCRSCVDSFKQSRDCDGKGSPKMIAGVEIVGCPMKAVTTQSVLYINAYHQYKSGYLANKGTWLDQPLKSFDAFSVIGKYIEEQQKKEMENAERKTQYRNTRTGSALRNIK